MKLKKLGSKLFLVNSFADLVLSKINPDEKTIISVTDYEHFYVVKGKCSSKEILDLSSVSLEFKSKFLQYIPESKNINTIDLIEYEYKFSEDIKISHKFHNSENCSYSQRQLDYWKEFSKVSLNENANVITDDEIVYQSEFPHGYSFNRGRSLYYYGKNIMYNIPPNYPVKTLTMTLSNIKNFHDEIEFKVFDENSETYDISLESAIRDVFNFDTTKIESEMKKMDLSLELTNPTNDFEILKAKVGDFIII